MKVGGENTFTTDILLVSPSMSAELLKTTAINTKTPMPCRDDKGAQIGMVDKIWFDEERGALVAQGTMYAGKMDHIARANFKLGDGSFSTKGQLREVTRGGAKRGSLGDGSLGQVAYEIYDEQRGGLNHLGKPNPTWANLPGDIRNAWEVSADAVAGLVRGGVDLPSTTDRMATALQASLSTFVREAQSEQPDGEMGEDASWKVKVYRQDYRTHDGPGNGDPMWTWTIEQGRTVSQL